MWIVLLFLVPGVTMGLFASEKTNGTQELLLTSPLTIWDLVLGKYLAAAAFVAILVRDGRRCSRACCSCTATPSSARPRRACSACCWSARPTSRSARFASSVTRNQLIAFFLAFVLLLILWLLAIVADLGVRGGAAAAGRGVSDLLRWLSTADHFEELMKGLVDTRDLAYFAVMIGTFLLLTKASVESVRWR